MPKEDFTKPDRPFLLIYTDTNDNNSASYSWFKTEESLIEGIKEVTSYGCEIRVAIEIDSCRNIAVD